MQIGSASESITAMRGRQWKPWAACHLGYLYGDSVAQHISVWVFFYNEQDSIPEMNSIKTGIWMQVARFFFHWGMRMWVESGRMNLTGAFLMLAWILYHFLLPHLNWNMINYRNIFFWKGRKGDSVKKTEINHLSCLIFLILELWVALILNYPVKINNKWVKLNSNNKALLLLLFFL